MSQTTSIEWTDVSWNPVHGCSKVSPGCAHCYAETLSRRYGHTPAAWTPANVEDNVLLKPHKLREPLRWKTPQMVFVNSMSDLFHEQVPDAFIEEVFAVMALAPQHTFQVLTKRPERMARLLRNPGVHINILSKRWDMARVADSPDARQRFLSDHPEHPLTRTCPWPLPNVWLGVSIENRRFVHRADALRQTPAAVRFISAEPLLGPLAPERMFCSTCSMEGPYDDCDECEGIGNWWLEGGLRLDDIDWLIVGGESGPGHRRFDPDWARDLRDLASDYETAFFVKQLGGARPGTKLEDLPEDLQIREFPRRAEVTA